MILTHLNGTRSTIRKGSLTGFPFNSSTRFLLAFPFTPSERVLGQSLGQPHSLYFKMTGGTYDTHSSFDFRHISYFLIHIWAADWTSSSSITFQKRSGYRLLAILPLIKKTTLFTLLATPAFSTSSLPLNLFRHCVSWFRKTCACFQDFLIRQKKKRPPVVLLMQEDTINKYNFVLKSMKEEERKKRKTQEIRWAEHRSSFLHDLCHSNTSSQTQRIRS